MLLFGKGVLGTAARAAMRRPLAAPSRESVTMPGKLSPAFFSARTLRTARPVRRTPSNPQYILYGLFGLNAGVYALWWYARDEAVRSGDNRMYRFMMSNFTSGEPNLRAGRWWTLLTASFSHQEFAHFGFNMLTFAFTAPALLPVIGAPQMLTLYIGSGLAASLASLAWPYVVDPLLHGDRFSLARKRYSLTQGASGSVYAMLAAYATMRPAATFYLYFALPIPAWVCVGGILAWELYASSYPRPGSHIDSVGHVGGLLAGIAFGRLRRF